MSPVILLILYPFLLKSAVLSETDRRAGDDPIRIVRTHTPVTPVHLPVRPVNPPFAPADPLPARPFPQHATYQAGVILPDHISRAVMDDKVRSFYKLWKQHYIKQSGHTGEKYVWFEGTTGTNVSVSEGQGYGMVIVALMAGYDTLAHETYDCLYRYARSHPCSSDSRLMAWSQDKNCHSIDGSSATDGDMDIAYSLLLANAQWGSRGLIDYREEGIRMIAAIRRQEINPVTWSVTLSNDVEHDSKDYFDMRSSDFMPAHFQAFRKVSGDASWDSVIDHGYRLFGYLQDKYSPEAGLLPDFIMGIRITQSPSSFLPAAKSRLGSLVPPPIAAGPENGICWNIHAVPARPHYLESTYDGVYNYNACRVPWRVATDYLVYGDRRAAVLLEKTNRWIRSTTGDNPDNISAGYDLTGVDLPHRNFEALSFISPFAVSAMISRDNQPWLNKIWDYITGFPLRQFDYYDNSIKMIDMIILSGNYWAP